MATGIILAGGTSRRMPGDKAFMEFAGLRVIDIQIKALRDLFERILIVGNLERIQRLSVYSGEGVEVVEEPVRSKGPLGGIMSGLTLSRSEENFVIGCDMPFVKAEAVAYVMQELSGYKVAVPETPGGLEPLHAAYRRDCLDVIERHVASGDLKITNFFEEVSVNRIPSRELARFDPTGRLLLNINSPEDMRFAAGGIEGSSEAHGINGSGS